MAPSTPVTQYNLINLAAYLINIIITFGVGSYGWFHRPTNGDIAQLYPTLITPANWTISIWFVIFMVQLAWVVYQFFAPTFPWVQAVDWNYLWVAAAQAAWTWTFSYQLMWPSLICMLALAALLWMIVLSLQRVEVMNTSSSDDVWKNLSSYGIWQLPFTMHCGWVTAATLVNINMVLVSHHLRPSFQFYAAIISLLVMLAVASMVAMSRDVVIPLVLAWAWYGIYDELKHPVPSIASKFTVQEIRIVQDGAGLAALVILAVVLVRFGMTYYRSNYTPLGASADEARYLRASNA